MATPRWKTLPVVYRGTVEFDGAAFFGFQEQPHRRTVQGVLKQTLADLLKVAPGDVVLFGSSRTDRGVHAEDLGISVHLPEAPPWPVEILLRAWRARLPDDVWLHTLGPAPPGFHARYSAVSKRYRYRWLPGKRSPLRRGRVWMIPDTPDWSRARAALTDVQGQVDFRSLTLQADGPFPVNLLHIALFPKDDEIWLEVEANRFGYKSVRLLAATLLDIARGVFPPALLSGLFRGAEHPAPRVAPAHGLTLVRTRYPASAPSS